MYMGEAGSLLSAPEVSPGGWSKSVFRRLFTALVDDLMPLLRNLFLRYYIFTEGGHSHPFSLAVEYGPYHARQW